MAILRVADTLKGPVTVFVICLKFENVLTKLFLPSVATGGKDEQGLKKLSLNAMLAKITKKYGLCSLMKFV